MIDPIVLKKFRNKKVLITGGTGLIGRQVVSILSQTGAKIKIVSLDKIKVDRNAQHIFGDLTDYSFCKMVTRNIDFLFHLAGIKGSIEVTKSKPASFFVPLLMMNTNILEAARVNNVTKVVYTSSIGAYSNAEIFREDQEKNGFTGEPMDLFPGWAKRMAELQIKSYQTQYKLNNFAIVRPCNVYGPGDNFDPNNAMVIPSIMARIKAGENPVVIWGNGSAIRDFAFSRDIAEGVILALFYGTSGRFVNLGSGKGHTIKELVETLNTFVNFNYKFDKSKSSGFKRRIMDITLAKKMIHWQPSTTLLNGLTETWTWYLKNSNQHLKKKNYFKN